MKKFALPHQLEGKITLETRDARTGKLCQQVSARNFAANQTIRFAKWLQRSLYYAGLTNIGSSNTDYRPHDPLTSIALTNSTLAENQSAEWTMPGALVGYANRATHAGTDPYRGTPNVAQLDAQPTYTKWVFDWPTNAGNGTINSVGFVRDVYLDSGTSGSGPYYATALTVEQSWSTTGGWTYFARASGSLAFGNTGNTSISVLDGTYTQTTTFNVNGQFTAVRGLAWDSTNSFLWVIGDNSSTRRIAAYDASGVLQSGPFSTTTRSYICLAHDGTNLWSMTQNSGANHTAWSINPSNGNDVSNFNFTTYSNTYYGYVCSAVGLAWDPTYSRLWVRCEYNSANGNDTNGQGTRGTMYSFDTSGNKQTLDINLNAYSPSAAAFNTYLWAGTANRRDFDIIDSSQFAMPSGSTIYKVRTDGLATRALLPSPVTKTNTQTLKVIYQINYS